MNPQTNLGALYRETREQFRAKGFENPGLEASVLLCSVTGEPPHRIVSDPQTAVRGKAAREFEDRVRRRLKNEPCAYITGTREFFSLSFAVSPAVLIPRPETETVVETALRNIPAGKKLRVADIGTGSGCIAIALKKEREEISVTASDISPAAIEIARQNALFHGTEINFVIGDALSRFADGSADIIVSNPPYVPEQEFESLPDDVRVFEPREALVSGDDGFEHIRKIVADAPRVLGGGGVCVMETGDGQAEKCAEIFSKNGFSDISAADDIGGKTRVVSGTWKK
ncbi:MAG: peptide chain release factor N(5)-glutamine methyltransferase [Thermodesulfobacteriota bacterium]